MSTLTDRIRPWTQNPPRNSATGELAILIIDEGAFQDRIVTWVAIRRDSIEPIAQGGPHPTRHDAVVDAIEHVPNWNIIRTL